MPQCDPTRVLRDEHRLILEVVTALERTLDHGPGEGARDRVGECVTFFRLFTDACHHGKEEDLLFGALTDQGLPRHQGPIAVMLHEHALGRALVGRMAAGLEALDGGSGDAWADVEDAGRAYVDLLRAHIGKEDNVLFDMADRMLPEPACRSLCDAYDAVCARRFEGRTLAELEALAATITGA